MTENEQADQETEQILDTVLVDELGEEYDAEDAGYGEDNLEDEFLEDDEQTRRRGGASSRRTLTTLMRKRAQQQRVSTK